MTLRALLPFALFIGFLQSHAGTDNLYTDSVAAVRPVYASYTVQSGSSHISDTYLSPIRYTGWQIGLGYDRLQAMKFNPDKWVQQLRFGLTVDRTNNIAGNSTMWSAAINFSWGMIHRWKLPFGLSAGTGSSAAIALGCIYLNRNGNNPVSAKASATINATGYLSWQTRIGSIPLILRYQPIIPLIGVFFAPDYGELYYEIYLGNHSGLTHFAWWGNHFRLDHRLTADFQLGGTSLRIGYTGNFFSSKVNHIVTETFSHGALIGVSGEWMSVNPRKPLSPMTRIISATY